jgi:outer membrane protein OmpA-like peptidoglycan-associated protein
MTSKIKMLAVTGLLLVGIAGPVFADPNYGVVHDSNGNAVRNTYGNCVHTKWLSDRQEMCPSGAAFTEEERTVYFEFNKSTLTADGKHRLNALIAKIKATGPMQNLQVVGYADRIGTPSYNEALSKKRAEAVHAYLVAHGLVHSGVGKTRWFGDTEPSTNCPADMARKELIKCLQPDRKVEVEVVYDP